MNILNSGKPRVITKNYKAFHANGTYEILHVEIVAVTQPSVSLHTQFVDMTIFFTRFINLSAS